jgi:hypothetical protein
VCSGGGVVWCRPAEGGQLDDNVVGDGDEVTNSTVDAE